MTESNDKSNTGSYASQITSITQRRQEGSLSDVMKDSLLRIVETPSVGIKYVSDEVDYHSGPEQP